MLGEHQFRWFSRVFRTPRRADRGFQGSLLLVNTGSHSYFMLFSEPNHRIKQNSPFLLSYTLKMNEDSAQNIVTHGETSGHLNTNIASLQKPKVSRYILCSVINDCRSPLCYSCGYEKGAITPCSLLKVNRRFGGKYLLLQDQ
jgi:hypothetical protein